jgi:hypothetical protein
MTGLDRLDGEVLRGGSLTAALDLLVVGAAPSLEAEGGFLRLGGGFRGPGSGAGSQHGRIFTTRHDVGAWTE